MMKRLSGGVGLVLLAGATVFSSAPSRDALPPITGIEHVTIYVSDMAKSRAFYGDALGLPAFGGYCTGNPKPCFSVNAEQYIELEPVPSPAPKNWVAEVAFATDYAEGMRKRLSMDGATVGPISSDGTLQRFEAQDAEGNHLAFVQRQRPPAEFSAAAKQISRRLLHAGFVVKDFGLEKKFYSLLGFRTYWYGGFKDEDIDWYEIQVPDGNNWVEYMLNIPPNADHKELGVQNHFSLGVKDAGVAAAQLKKHGLAKFDGPEVGRDGKNSLDAYDPDGTRVEVMEFTPRQTPCCHAYEAAHPSP
jgi:catechol 2,3-dioxygenase-like lactoylglutathione lyase family enzyme